MAGITYKVSRSENNNPPMMAIPMDIRLVDAFPRANAMGNTPSMVAILVMRIGLNRKVDASTTALKVVNPACLR